jgi:uncharacterized membrane protein HdeD (DUF308 family)
VSDDEVVLPDERNASVTNLTRLVGALLIVIGVGAWLLSDAASVTALIPAMLGVLLLVLGLLAGRPAMHSHAMHGAMVVALVGVLGTLMQVVELPALLTGGDVERPLAVVVSSLTLVLCAVLLVLGIRSFVAARRARTLASS